ncbi:MAG: cytochrome c [Deltaproteobacteria bacterium]|nr:cytochrome c [Deltaproteobacteria bacterium]
MKNWFLTALVLLVGATLCMAQQPYDKSAAAALMQSNKVELAALEKAVAAADFDEAAMRLSRLAANISRLPEYAAPKGEKADWDKRSEAFLKAAYSGIAACVSKDVDSLKAAVAEVKSRRGDCHKNFR